MGGRVEDGGCLWPCRLTLISLPQGLVVPEQTGRPFLGKVLELRMTPAKAQEKREVLGRC